MYYWLSPRCLKKASLTGSGRSAIQLFCNYLQLLPGLFFLCCASAAGAVNNWQQCFEQAGHIYRIAPDLLKAVAQVESAFNPQALHTSSQSQDIGLMQINSGHLRRLADFGITRQKLFDPCVSIHTGAWVLAGNIARIGPVWEAVGAYNASCTALKGEECRRTRDTYIAKVQKAFASIANANKDKSAVQLAIIAQ